jgi:predicted negative regulator of RcsB-dependent stress response
MTKKHIIIIILVLLILGGGYYYWKTNIQKSPTEQAVEDIQKTVESINQDVTQGVVPSIDSAANSMENLPDTNPYSNTNPFKVNPFK